MTYHPRWASKLPDEFMGGSQIQTKGAKPESLSHYDRAIKKLCPKTGTICENCPLDDCHIRTSEL